MTQERINNIVRGVVGTAGWAIVCYGAWSWGGIGMLLIAIGVPLMIHNW